MSQMSASNLALKLVKQHSQEHDLHYMAFFERCCTNLVWSSVNAASCCACTIVDLCDVWGRGIGAATEVDSLAACAWQLVGYKVVIALQSDAWEDSVTTGWRGA